jgi:hypothetical protein
VPGSGNDEPKHSFPARPARSEFIRPKHRRSNKTLLFLFAALTIRRAVAKSIIQSCLIGSRDLQWFLLESGSLRREKR